MAAQPYDEASGLTEREYQVLKLTAEGMLLTQIAKHLYLGDKTVKEYRAKGNKKLGAKNAANAVYLATKAGII